MTKLIFSAVFCISSLHCLAQTNTIEDFKKLTWLVGEWSRTNIKPGRSGSEKWIKSSPLELQGWGITMKEKDTVLIEKTKLIIKDKEIYYVADVPENKKPVYFKVTKITEDQFICENPEHDFPKVITYKRQGNQLKATISGNGKAIDYLFEKKM